MTLPPDLAYVAFSSMDWFIAAVLLGTLGVAALITSSVAVAIVGPRRGDALTLPALAACLIAVVTALAGAPIPLLIGAMFLGALAIAGLQRGSLARADTGATRSTSPIVTASRLLAGVLIGVAVGLVFYASMQIAAIVVGLGIVGLSVAIATLVPRPARRPTDRPADPGRPAGILDE